MESEELEMVMELDELLELVGVEDLEGVVQASMRFLIAICEEENAMDILYAQSIGLLAFLVVNATNSKNRPRITKSMYSLLDQAIAEMGKMEEPDYDSLMDELSEAKEVH